MSQQYFYPVVPVSTIPSGVQHVIVDSSALPTGASTSALQTTGNSSLASIATNTSNIPPEGQALMAASLPVVIASNQTAIPISGSVTATNTANGNTGAAVPVQATQVAGVGPDGNLHALSTDNSGVLDVVINSSALPSGASTSALQTTGNTSLSSIISNQTNGTQTTQISGTVPLPTGAATSALQTTGNSSLATIATNTPPLGQALMASSSPVVIASNQSAIPISAASLPLPTGASTSALQTTINTTLGSPMQNSGGTVIVTQTTGTNLHAVIDSGSVSVSNFPATQPISGSVTVTQATGTNLHAVIDSSALPTGAATSANQTNASQKTQIVDGSGNVIAATSNALNVQVANFPGTQPISGSVTVTQATGTNLHTVVDSGTITAVTAITNALPAGTNLLGKVGIDQTTPGTTNAVSLAQIGATTVATGNGTVSAGVQRVVIASDQTAFAVTTSVTNSATSTLTSVGGATSSTSLLALNTSRKGAYFFNDSTATLYLAFASSASTSAYTVQIASNGFYEMPNPTVYTGAIFGIWSAANGNVRITELT